MKKKVIKKSVCVFLCFMFIFLNTFAVLAYEKASEDEQPTRFAVISTTSCNLVISGINSTSYATMQTSRIVSLSIKMELQKLKSGAYSTIETWSTSKTGSAISISEDRLINIFSDYRLKVTFKADSETYIAYTYPN